MAPRKTRIRVIDSRGHRYAQEVRYEWDPAKKRGVTHVLRSLGPVDSSLRSEGRRLAPEEIQKLLATQKAERSASRPAQRVPRVVWLNGRVEVHRDSPQADNGPSPQNGEPVAAVLPLTGGARLERFDRRILEIVRGLGQNATRTSVFEVSRSEGLERPNHHQTLRRHVSFALTRLYRKGLVKRFGEGGVGHPYRYSL